MSEFCLDVGAGVVETEAGGRNTNRNNSEKRIAVVRTKEYNDTDRWEVYVPGKECRLWQQSQLIYTQE